MMGKLKVTVKRQPSVVRECWECSWDTLRPTCCVPLPPIRTAGRPRRPPNLACRARRNSATRLPSWKSGEPIGQSKHLASDLAYWPVLGLYRVILHAYLIEVLCPPPRPDEFALWSSGLALADPLLQRRQRRMEPNDGDRRTRYRL